MNIRTAAAAPPPAFDPCSQPVHRHGRALRSAGRAARQAWARLAGPLTLIVALGAAVWLAELGDSALLGLAVAPALL